MATNNLISVDTISSRILILRGEKVILDKDLALLYEVKPIALRQQVKRNRIRFPEDFMFRLSDREVKNMVSQNVIPSKKYFGGYLPYAFTEQGVAMLSSVLSSKKAISVNIQIMRTFYYLRKMLLSHRDLQDRLDVLERKYDVKFKNVFDAIKLLLQNDMTINKRLSYEEDKQKNKKFGFQPPARK
ncbi:DNA-binding protein [Candidatus Termititenax aidoneus]|uniref:DNA-binding protein n=1 Tax=Termititenax aidoneus TaxID=2218524 RepID=A0A388TAP4_TERA1|nr:DNA-binding protein [Candidatus Termititenax aidoneus]